MTEDETLRLAEELAKEYRAVRILPDGSIAGLSNLMYTTAVFLGLTRWGWEKRFCFEDPELAQERFLTLATEADEPAGYIARRVGS